MGHSLCKILIRIVKTPLLDLKHCRYFLSGHIFFAQSLDIALIEQITAFKNLSNVGCSIYQHLGSGSPNKKKIRIFIYFRINFFHTNSSRK